MLRTISALFFSLVIFTSCQKENDVPDQPSGEQNLTDVAYGSDAAQKMDIYLPAGRTDTTRVIVLIHGGAWMDGDKSDFAPYMAQLKQKLPGYAIFNINYRLATQTTNHFPAQENDVKLALEFIYGKRNEYRISDKFILLGASAGGHLALLHSYKYSTPVKISAVVSFFGPTELVSLYNSQTNPLLQFAMQVLLGGTPTTNPTAYQQSSPVNFINSQSPPTMILQGGLDPIVPPAQATQLQAKLQTAGVVHQYVFYPTEAHGWTGANLDDSFNRIEAFIKARVR